MHVVKFFPSEEIVRRFSEQFCLHFHGTVSAILRANEEELEGTSQIDECAFHQAVSQVFYQSIQRFTDQESLARLARTRRFSINTMIDRGTSPGQDHDVKIIADLIPNDVAERLSPCHVDDQFLAAQVPTLH